MPKGEVFYRLAEERWAQINARGMRSCSVCKEEKTLDNFYRLKDTHPGKTDRYASACRQCRCASSVASHAALSPQRKAEKAAQKKAGREKRHYQARVYGLSTEQFEQMLANQNGLCAICVKPETLRRCLSVDHDHSTNLVRSLLCIKCNAMLGQANEDPDILRKAAEYLEKHREIQKLELLYGK